MPLNSHQLAALVERARLKATPVVSPPAPAPQRHVRPRQAAPAPPQPEKPAPLPAEPTAPDDRPWFLDKSSWRFHRRFYVVFRRPMQRGEYSSLLKQIRFGHAEHLGEDCWCVMLPVRATPWRLITILPKDWQPRARAE